MGTWGADSFQNDWALDWLGDFRERGDASLVHAALNRVVEHGGTKHHPASLLEKFLGRRSRTDWLTADVASKALAAAQLVAAWNSHPSPNLPDGILALLRQNQSSFRVEFVTLAQQAVAIVKTNSELKELWDETDATEWNKVIADLESRLSAS